MLGLLTQARFRMMLKDTFIIVASCIIAITMWISFVEPALTVSKHDDIFIPHINSEVTFERALLTQRNNFTGKVKIIEEDGKTIIRLEDINQKLSIPACRNTQVKLTLDYAKENSLVLGPLKASTGNMNYLLPPGEDIKNYNGVQIWCKTFSFDYAHVEIIAPDKKPLFLK